MNMATAVTKFKHLFGMGEANETDVTPVLITYASCLFHNDGQRGCQKLLRQYIDHIRPKSGSPKIKRSLACCLMPVVVQIIFDGDEYITTAQRFSLPQMWRV